MGPLRTLNGHMDSTNWIHVDSMVVVMPTVLRSSYELQLVPIQRGRLRLLSLNFYN